MTTPVPLSALEVVPLRYSDTKRAEGDGRGIDAYAAADVYAVAGVPVYLQEPQFPEELRTHHPTRDLGIFNGKIAEQVAGGRAEQRAILLTGGNCSHITGVFGGLQDAHGPGVRVGLVWFDAHGDFNTPQTTLSGMLGGMPVAVCAGLAFPEWREASHIVAPLPTDRIVMVDVRNLDPAEEQLIRAVGIPTVPVTPSDAGSEFQRQIGELAERCDMLYLHIDSDILDERYVPGHGTAEPDGPNMEQVLAAVDVVMGTGKVVVYAVVSINAGGPKRERSVATGIELISGGLESWKHYGTPALD